MPSTVTVCLFALNYHYDQNEDLWLAAVRLERRHEGGGKQALALMAKALQQSECPSSGKLWAEAISTEARPQQKSRSVDALKKCDNNPHVIVAVACLFMRDRKFEKARSWFNRAVTLDPDNGDAWASYLRFATLHGKGEDEKESLLKRAVAADPRHGDLWCKAKKGVENCHASTEAVMIKVAQTM